ncbi:hypothetical protein C8R46DRAFT_1135277 [Mycena filopes]|nr:hypothetical protein C8R46DRAFT_1138444 [Mycena filopes]KAJ7141567.1 hypothetical protein C8R46DRAFT_1135277 [Mycena filopes]
MLLLRTAFLLLTASNGRVQAQSFATAIFVFIASVTNEDSDSLLPKNIPRNNYCLYGRVLGQPGSGETNMFLGNDTTIRPLLSDIVSADDVVCSIYPNSDSLTQSELYSIYCTPNGTSRLVVTSDSASVTSLVPGPSQAGRTEVQSQWKIEQAEFQSDSLSLLRRYYMICTPSDLCWVAKAGRPVNNGVVS